MKLWQPEVPSGIYYAVVNTSTTTTIVIGRPNQQINLISASIIVSASTTLTWQSSTGSVGLSGPQSISPTGGYILPFNAGGWLQTAINDSLVLAIAPSVSIGGMISYVWIEQPGN
jgi:hypothetical protein